MEKRARSAEEIRREKLHVKPPIEDRIRDCSQTEEVAVDIDALQEDPIQKRDRGGNEPVPHDAS